MFYPITNPSALDFWLHKAPSNIQFKYLNKYQVAQLIDSDSFFFKEQVLSFARDYQLDIPLHVNVDSVCHRSHGNSLFCHAITRDLPSNSFVELPGPVYMISPELCFLLSARDLSFWKLSKLGYDLCAMYMVDKNEEYGQRSRTPLTKADNIRSFLDSAKGFPYVREAKLSARYILDNSNSPVETKLAFPGCLPFYLGGFALLPFELNPEIGLSQRASEEFGMPTCLGDLFWKQSRVDLEYNSYMTHLTPSQHERDRKRLNALSESGIRVVTVTRGMLNNRRTVDNLYMNLRHILKMRPKTEQLEKYQDVRWKLLYEIFFEDLPEIF